VGSRTPKFDPTTLPSEPVFGEQPVLAQNLSADQLRRQFQKSPDWQPEFQSDGFRLAQPLRDAAVLIALVLRDHQTPSLLLTRRSANLGSHAGQIAFPGGRVDETDVSPIAAALREAQEEVGMPQQAVEILGTMPTYTTGTGFLITPVVGLVQPNWPLLLSEGEVDEAFEVPLDFLMNPDNHRRVKVRFEERERMFYSMPYPQDTQRYFIWGATAAMLRNLYHFLKA
jgi:8-oxo-dGTP pyrophosphatase MutT (NUDIX family)